MSVEEAKAARFPDFFSALPREKWLTLFQHILYWKMGEIEEDLAVELEKIGPEIEEYAISAGGPAQFIGDNIIDKLSAMAEEAHDKFVAIAKEYAQTIATLYGQIQTVRSLVMRIGDCASITPDECRDIAGELRREIAVREEALHLDILSGSASDAQRNMHLKRRLADINFFRIVVSLLDTELAPA